MKAIMEAVKEFCRSNDIRFEEMGDDPVLRLGVAGKNASFFTYVTVEEEDRALSFRTIYPITVPKNRLPQIIEVTTLANGGIRLGSFEVSLTHGRIAFKTSAMFGPQDPDDTMIKHLCFANWASSDHFFPACSAVLFGDISPKEAIKLVEADGESADTDSCSSKPAGSGASTAGQGWGGRLGHVMGPSSN